ncbi:MAG: hypothetical protein U1E17_02935 [Geminicoccaceae bacterium]
MCTAADYGGAGAARSRQRSGPADGPRRLRLTRRRQQDALFELVEQLEHNEQIGQALQLSARTVKIHLQAAYRAGRQLARQAIRLMLCTPTGSSASAGGGGTYARLAFFAPSENAGPQASRSC